MKKRLLALLLCLVMVIGLVPTAFAADDGKNQVSLNFVYEGEIPEGFVNFSRNVPKGTDDITLPAIEAPTGYSFAGWYSELDTDREWPVTVLKGGTTEDMTFYGVWSKDTTPAPGLTVTYQKAKDLTEGQITDAYFSGYKFRKYPTDWTIPEDKEFDGWTDGVKVFQAREPLTGLPGNLVVYPVFKNKDVSEEVTVYYRNELGGPASFKVAKDANIIIDPNGGKFRNSTATAYLAIPSDAIIEDATSDSKVFVGWLKSTEGDFVKLTAQWKEDTATEYTVTFYCWKHQYKSEDIPLARNTKIVIDPNGGRFLYDGDYTTKTQRFDLTSNYKIANAERTGYTFYGWKATVDTRTKTVTFTAQWSKDYPYYNTYSIYYYDYDDGKSEYANFPYGTSVVIDPNGGTAKLSGTSFSTKQSFNIYRDYTLTDAARSGYTFYGWDLTKSGSTYYFTAMWSRYKSDVPYMLNGTDHYAYIKGYPNGSFKPTDTITRAEAATIFYRLLTDSTRKAYATTYNSFKDVPATAWYNTAVSTMAKLGIVNGGADGYFRPNDPITRAEIAAMIARCDGAYYTGTSTVFSDTYGHWAASYIARAYELGWINGYGTTYAPDRYISRAETVAVLNRVLNRAPQYTSDLTRNYTTFSDVATSAWYYLDVEEAANSHTYTRKTNADYETWTKLIADPSWF